MGKKKKIITIIIAVVVIAAVWFFIGFVIGGPEDDWICVDGEWVKHGAPSAPMPTEPCGEIACEKHGIEDCPKKCAVCPPCIECSSIGCQTEAFCESIGFDKDWYDSVKSGPPAAETECREEQRNVDACIEIYQPVCATVNIQCFTTPCDPIEETYSNSCKACSNPLVSSYKEGECR